ncbi:MAG: nucleotidyltransferase domain-containing protein [Nitrososphaeria archaeon]
MSIRTEVDVQLEILSAFKKYYENVNHYVNKIKALVRKYDPSARVILFGSYVRGNMGPDSDIDVLLITRLASDVKERVRLRIEIKRAIGDLTPFEIHIVTEEEYKSWYKKFIDQHVEV